MKHAPLVGLLACLGLTGTAAAQNFDYTDFSSVAGLELVGLAIQNGTVVQLQDNLAPAVNSDNRGAMWYASPVNVAAGFDTTFTYRMHTPSTTGGSDGMAFVIQNDQVAGVPMVNGSPDGTGNRALGRHAAAMGYGVFMTSGPGESVENSLAIELDTFMGATWGDLDNNHISIHTSGTGDNSPAESTSIGRTGSLGTNLNAGLSHTVRVVYTPGAPGAIEVFLDGASVLSVPYSFATGGTWVDSGTPVGGLGLIGGTSAYVGFTSGAGSAREFRDVESWSFSSGAAPSGFCTAKTTLKRAGSTNSTGTPGGANCDGNFAIDMNAFAAGLWIVPDCAGAPSGTPPNNPAPFLLAPGQDVYCQYWGRDSVASGSFVSDGLRYSVGP